MGVFPGPLADKSEYDKQNQTVSLAQGNLWLGTRLKKNPKTKTKNNTSTQILEAGKSHWHKGGEENHLSCTLLQIDGTCFTRNYIRCSYAKRGVNQVNKS